jgi:UDP-N-acetylglucosamine--N-acetylmuramyl-(pentapeptide) pyrophosphoryl-undecaprenol N-acetylglucosamine transferase
MRILFTGGATGGHIMPIVAVANNVRFLLSAKNIAPEFLFISTKSSFNTAIANLGIPIKIISAYKIRRYWSVQNITEIINLPIGILQAMWHLFWFMPDVVFAKGGYVSLPAVIAAWIYRIPVIIHESDSVAGLANVISGKLASKVAVSFNEASSYFSSGKVILTGNPIRQEVLQGTRDQAAEEFKLAKNLPTILVLGGSQGAQKINEVFLRIVPKIVSKVQIIHVSGVENYEEIKKEIIDWQIPHLENYHLYPFLFENLKDAYAASDIVVSRAGANNLAEIISVAKPAILIPLPTAAGDHQLKNAYYFASRGAAVLLEEVNLTPNMLYDAIFGILENKEKQMQMVRAERSLAMPGAARKIAEEIIKLAE